MSLSLKLLTIPLVGLGGASALISLSFSNSSNRLSIYEKIKKLGGDCKEVKSRENGESDNSVGVLVVCLEEKGSDKKQVTFKWFKNYQDISPAKVKWLTSTGLGIVKVQLEEDEDGKEELFVPSEEVFRGNSVITVVKPASNKEHKFDGSNCQIQSKEKDWGVNCT